jgi:penicillin-binding protein 1A
MNFVNQSLKWILRLLKTIFIQPFIWYRSLSLRKKILVGLFTFLTGCLLVLCIPLLLFYAIYSGMIGEIPGDKELLTIKNYQASEVYSSDSVLLGRYFVQNRSDAKYEEVSHYLFDAIIATEDARFYEHTGVDTKSLLRVLFKSIILRQKKGGGSTITQQLAKNIFGRKKYPILTIPVNKIREVIIANQLEKLYSKKEILMLYVNTVSFGEDTYGIKTSSQRFFNIPPSQLASEQAAVLAGMLKSPTIYNPRRNPAKALERRNTVLSLMQKHKYLTKEELLTMTNKPLVIHYNRFDHSEGQAPHFRERLRTEIEQLLLQYPKADGTHYNLYTDGLKIYTTIHSRIQRYAEEAAVDQLKHLQPLLEKDLQRTAFFKKHNDLLQSEWKKSDKYKVLSEKNLSPKDLSAESEKKDTLHISTLWGDKDLYMSPLDSIKFVLSTMQVGFLVVNPHTGAVLAWVGGANYKQTQYDHVLAKRQAGSVFKPIVYAQGLLNGMRPCDFIANQKITYSQYDNWTPENSNEKEDGRYSMAGALANSVNTISVQICMKAGIKNVINLARTMGIESELPSKPSIALGTADLSVWELTGAYTTFANNGNKTDLQFLSSVVNDKGEKIFQQKPSSKTILTPEQAHEMTNMLCNVVDFGTAHELRNVYGLGGKIAGKTGTTQDHKDGWFMGYTSGFLAGVWVGADNPGIHFSGMHYGRGAATAMPVWAGFYKRIMKDRELNYLLKPFPFENTIDCEMYKDNTLFQKIFQRKNKSSNRTGLEEKRKKERKKGRRGARK